MEQKKRTAGIMNLVGAGLLVVLIVAALLTLCFGGLNFDGTNEEALGLVIASFILLALLSIIALPICLIGGIWQVFFGIRLLKASDGASWLYVISAILKALVFLSLCFSAVLLYSIWELPNQAVAILFAAAAVLLAFYQIALIVVEQRAKKPIAQPISQ